MMLLKKFGLVAVLLTGMMNAVAMPGAVWTERDAERTARQLRWAQSSEARRGGEAPEPRQFENRGDRDHGRQFDRADRDHGRQFDRQIPDRQIPSGPPAQAVPDEPKRGGKMSPEERRELRRQINEAGQNIYTPKR